VGEARARGDFPARLLTHGASHGTVNAVDGKQMRKKHDRELIELLNELRVALPGVQVLFAFLLIAPFSSRFHATSSQKVAYTVALGATVLATMLLMAPSAYHRLRWRERNKERMLRTSNRLAIAGIAAIAVAMSASVYLVTDTLFDDAFTIAATAACALLFAFGWFLLPLSTPYDRWDEDEEEELVGPD
jgi:amino acid transporter